MTAAEAQLLQLILAMAALIGILLAVGGAALEWLE